MPAIDRGAQRPHPGTVLLVAALLWSLHFLPAAAQPHLVPGEWGSQGNYAEVLRLVFDESYQRDVPLRAQIRTKYGVERMLFLQKGDEGYQLVYMRPPFPIWTSDWRQSADESTLHTAGLPERPYHSINFSAVDTLRTERHTRSIETPVAQLLIDVWDEMLMRSRYEESPTISTGGVTYTYGTRRQTLGAVTAHSRNPKHDTPASDLGQLTRSLEEVARAPDEAADSLLHRATQQGHQLMGRLLEKGAQTPVRGHSRSVLAACTDPMAERLHATYCWQGPLVAEAQPSFVIAKENEGSYQFALIHATDENVVRHVPIVPVGNHHTAYGAPEETGWHYYALKPWDLLDLWTHTCEGELRVFSLPNIKSAAADDAHPATGILFEAVGWRPSNRSMLAADRDADSDWVSVVELLETAGTIELLE